jgi:hypothetical protein
MLSNRTQLPTRLLAASIGSLSACRNEQHYTQKTAFRYGVSEQCAFAEPPEALLGFPARGSACGSQQQAAAGQQKLELQRKNDILAGTLRSRHTTATLQSSNRNICPP